MKMLTDSRCVYFYGTISEFRAFLATTASTKLSLSDWLKSQRH
jgi:hypothetical protein